MIFNNKFKIIKKTMIIKYKSYKNKSINQNIKTSNNFMKFKI